MPQEALLRALEEDAKTQSGNIINSAKEAAEAIISRAAEEAESLRLRRLDALDEALARKRAALVNSARTRANAEKLRVRHELIEQAFKEALERIRAADGDEYAALLNTLIRELADAFGKSNGCSAKILVNPSDAGLVAGAPLEVEADSSVSLGAVITSTDGRLVCENTVGSRIEKSRSALLPVVDKLLFG